MKRHGLKVGISFGLTSSIITTIGLMIGLASGTQERYVVIIGILTAAIVDALSDALGIHLSEESEAIHAQKEIWFTSFATLFSKMFFSLIFLPAVLFFPLNFSVIINIVLGFSLLFILSIFIAKEENEKAWKVVIEHLVIATFVIILSHYIGILIKSLFQV
ncbi:MAG: hypothetical protein QXL97_02470 [Candidatus Aenigmatarchaeota archaeon]